MPSVPNVAGMEARGGAATAFRPYDIAEPFGFYAQARAESPVFFSEELGYWVVSRYEDIRAIFKDPATFSSENTQEPYKPRPPEVAKIFADAGVSHASSGLSGRQPPDHTRLRGFINKAFTPRRIDALEPEVRAQAVAMIERMATGGRADLVGDLVYELPARVIFHLVGVPESDVPMVKRWAASRVLLNFGDLPVEEQIHHAESLAAYWRYCVALVEANLEQPRDDLTGALAQIYLDGDQSLSIDEIAGLIHTQLFAGHETTTGLLGEGLKELLRNRGRWEEVCAEPELIPNAVEEMLRVAPPVFTWRRRAMAPVRVGDVDLPAGANILMLLGSANRDEAVFEDGERIDLHRENARAHLAFGHGIHFCLGASLARLEARVVLEELTTRLPGLRLVEGQRFAYAANTTFRGPRAVLVEWEEPLVVGLDRCRALDVASVGGKAAALGELIGAGFPVPPGFAITTEAAQRGIDAEVRRAIAAAYAALGPDAPVAVRSSATAEDSAEDSFAGQQETYLWVVGEAAVLDAVERCWASAGSERSVAYRRDRGIADAAMRMGVAVQRMVRADAAGVAMTLDPATGDRTTIAIESSFGLGESVVGGTVTPDAFRLDRVMLEVVSAEIADKPVELVADEQSGGVVERSVEAGRRLQPSLTREQIVAVAELAKRAERHFGCPQDIEFAVEDGTVLLLQSRPETVWSRRAPERATPVPKTGLAGIVQTLNNPLAARRGSDDD